MAVSDVLKDAITHFKQTLLRYMHVEDMLFTTIGKQI